MALQPPVILIADDDPDLRQLVRIQLESSECVIYEASDGAKAVEELLVRKPDLIILDVMMPQLTGWEVLRYLRNSPELKNTGVLMLTGIGETLNELSSPMCGADGCIAKPFKSAALLVKVRRILSKRRRAASPAV